MASDGYIILLNPVSHFYVFVALNKYIILQNPLRHLCTKISGIQCEGFVCISTFSFSFLSVEFVYIYIA